MSLSKPSSDAFPPWCLGRIPGLRLEANSATHAFLRRIVDDNLMTSRHHAEEALRALRAVDLKPRGPLRAVEVEAPRAHQACPQCGRKMVGGREQANGSDATIHDCPQCGELVCRRCLAISVFDKASGAVLRICRCANISIFMACVAPLANAFMETSGFWPPSPRQALCVPDLPPPVRRVVGPWCSVVEWRGHKGLLQLWPHGRRAPHRDQGQPGCSSTTDEASKPLHKHTVAYICVCIVYGVYIG